METDYFIRRNTYDIYFVHWFVWIVRFIGREKKKRNRYTKSAGRICATYCYNTFNRFYQACRVCFNNCMAISIYGCKQMVAEFSLSYNNKLVDVRFSRSNGDIDCIAYCKFPGN